MREKEGFFVGHLVKLFTVIFFTILGTIAFRVNYTLAEPVSGSYSYLFEVKSASGIGALNQPAGIDIDEAGNIYVADTVNSRVVVFDDLGKVKFIFGKLGDKNGELKAPMALVIDNRVKKIYVADSSNHRIQVFSISGEFIAPIDLNKGLEDGLKPVRPIGIAVSSEGNIYVSDADNNYIRAYSAGGKFLFKFGGFGKDDGKLCLPVGLFMDKQDKLYVVDMSNARLQVFDKQGKFLFKIGERGDTKGSFASPKDVCVDEKGFIYVSDAGNLVVQVFDKNGKFHNLIGAEKDKNLQFASPFGLGVHKKRLYVTDRWRNSVRVYEIKN